MRPSLESTKESMARLSMPRKIGQRSKSTLPLPRPPCFGRLLLFLFLSSSATATTAEEETAEDEPGEEEG